MPAMPIRPVSSATSGRLLAAACILFTVACVPRPATPASPSFAAEPASIEPSPAAPSVPIGPTPSPSFVRPTPLPAPTFLVYTVRSGDTLTSIAAEFHTTPRSIAFWSRGEHPSLDPESSNYRPDRLEIDWVLLLIPGGLFDEDELPDATPSLAPDATAAS
jgi:hypothetical protein